MRLGHITRNASRRSSWYLVGMHLSCVPYHQYGLPCIIQPKPSGSTAHLSEGRDGQVFAAQLCAFDDDPVGG